MFRRNLYYSLKPLLPRALRRTVRGWFARRKLRDPAVRAVWPILESAGEKPAGWPGWPDGKQFAFVLTHDVEGPEGLANVRPLAELEMSLGFRSSFNFIPEGDYTVPAELRSWLLDNGFEVGVHDLHHDGKLYKSRAEFARRAKKINGYLKEWGAVGYRSGFMLHNYDWHHDLEIAYDASSFDTDPFEPQPDGVGTIFPFWVPAPDGAGQSQGTSHTSQVAAADLQPSDLRPSTSSSPDLRPATLGPSTSGSPGPTHHPPPITDHPATPRSRRDGYVELPYTLPQDSTLFFILREKGPEIWLRKLDWIASKGGMALVNVHPDYVRFSGEAARPKAYSVEHYAELLRHLRDRHAAACWHRLPREVAAFTAKSNPRPTFRRPRRIGMVTHSFYLSDNRVRRYAEALAARGDHVEVIAIGDKNPTSSEQLINGVQMIPVRSRRTRDEQTKLDYFWPILSFFIKSGWQVSWRHWRKQYDCVHIHNIPDFMVFSAWLPKLTGTPVILDIHDIVPELFASKFGEEPHGAKFRILCWMEWLSAHFANRIIVANDLWLEKYERRTRSIGKCTTFINNVDQHLFHPRRRQRKDDRLIVLFPGSLQWHQGVDLAIRAFPKVLAALPKAEFHIYGGGQAQVSLAALVRELGIEDQVRLYPGVVLDRVPELMAEADLGVVPKRADSFGNEAYSTKIMEFMAVGVPVVVSSTKIDRFYFNDDVVRFFESGNVDALAAAMIELLRDPALRRHYVERAQEFAHAHSWETRKKTYLALVDRLCDRG